MLQYCDFEINFYVNDVNWSYFLFPVYAIQLIMAKIDHPSWLSVIWKINLGNTTYHSIQYSKMHEGWFKIVLGLHRIHLYAKHIFQFCSPKGEIQIPYLLI